MIGSHDNNSNHLIQYNHVYTLPFELKVNHSYALYLTQTYWHHTFVIAFIYVIVIKLLEYWMKHKLPFQLSKVLVLWNAALAVFSILGTIRAIEEFGFSIFGGSFYKSVCFPAPMHTVIGDWALLFALSKFVELGDTIFLVLRKRPVSFLHIYHHCTVLVLCWISGAKQAAIARWFANLNYMAHSVMYTYYTCMSAGVTVPRKIAKCVTLFQLTQFIIGLCAIVSACCVKMFSDWPCYNDWTILIWGILIYLSYFVLFWKYFMKNYRRKFDHKYDKQKSF